MLIFLKKTLSVKIIKYSVDWHTISFDAVEMQTLQVFVFAHEPAEWIGPALAEHLQPLHLNPVYIQSIQLGGDLFQIGKLIPVS